MAAIGWHVVSQMEDSQPTPSGEFVDGVVVGFVADNGFRGSVFVPNEIYGSPDAIRDMIATKVEQSQAVTNLAGGS